MTPISCKSQINRLRACFFTLILALLPACLTATSFAGQAARQDYLVYVVCESADKIALIRFGQHGAQVDKLIDTDWKSLISARPTTSNSRSAFRGVTIT